MLNGFSQIAKYREIGKLISQINQRSQAAGVNLFTGAGRRCTDYKCIHQKLVTNVWRIYTRRVGVPPLAAAQPNNLIISNSGRHRNPFCPVKCPINRFRTSRQIFSIDMHAIHSL